MTKIFCHPRFHGEQSPGRYRDRFRQQSTDSAVTTTLSQLQLKTPESAVNNPTRSRNTTQTINVRSRDMPAPVGDYSPNSPRFSWRLNW